MLGDAAVSTCFYTEDRCHRQESPAAKNNGVLNEGEMKYIRCTQNKVDTTLQKKVFIKHFILDILWGNIQCFVIIRVVGEQCLESEGRPHYSFHG